MELIDELLTNRIESTISEIKKKYIYNLFIFLHTYMLLKHKLIKFFIGSIINKVLYM